MQQERGLLHFCPTAEPYCILSCFYIKSVVFILPWGLNLGAAGAGLATFLSNCGALLYFVLFLYKKRGDTYVCIRPDKFTLERNIVRGVCNVGIPASIQNLLKDQISLPWNEILYVVCAM